MNLKAVSFIFLGLLFFAFSGNPVFSQVLSIFLFLLAAVLITAGVLLFRKRPSSTKHKRNLINRANYESTPVECVIEKPKPVIEKPKLVIDTPHSVVPSLNDVIELFRPNQYYRFTEKDHAIILEMKDFCVLDVETTGLNWRKERIVQIGIIKLVDLVPVFRLNTLVNPEMHIPPETTKIHGIADEDVLSAPKYADIADQVFSLLNNSTIVGHNVTFDLNFIQYLLLYRSNSEADLSFDYVDTEQYARQVLPGMPNYQLQTLLKYYDIDPGAAHTAYDDAFATLKLFHALRYEYTHKEELAAKRAEEKKAERKNKREVEKAERRSTFAASPLLEQRFCFTGSFSLDREAMEKLAISVGALVQAKEPNGKTSYLVKGDVSDLPDWALERKLRKAESLSAAGKPVKIISEAEYLQLISDAKSALSASSEAVIS